MFNKKKEKRIKELEDINKKLKLSLLNEQDKNFKLTMDLQQEKYENRILQDYRRWYHEQYISNKVNKSRLDKLINSMLRSAR